MYLGLPSRWTKTNVVQVHETTSTHHKTFEFKPETADRAFHTFHIVHAPYQKEKYMYITVYFGALQTCNAYIFLSTC